MNSKQIKISVFDDQVITLDKLAKSYGEWYGVSASAHPETESIWFTTSEGEAAYVDASGFAYTRSDDRHLDDYVVNWAEELDVPDLVWAHDEDGTLVALIN